MSGRKTDVDDAEWLMALFAYGLFRPCYQSDANSRKLRTYTRMREQYVEMSATAVQRMQNAMELMNIKLTEVLSNVVGVSGIKLIEADFAIFYTVFFL
ncbi:MAG: transposase [Alloprevotella sp.]|nr:transposase [Alloprevotella sp.]